MGLAGGNLLLLADAGLGYLFESPAGDTDQPLRTQTSALAALYDTAGSRNWPVNDTDAIAATIGPSWPSGVTATSAMLDASGLPGASSLAAAYRTAAGASQPSSNWDVLVDTGTKSAGDLRNAGQAAGKAVSFGAGGALALLLAATLLVKR